MILKELCDYFQKKIEKNPEIKINETIMEYRRNTGIIYAKRKKNDQIEFLIPLTKINTCLNNNKTALEAKIYKIYLELKEKTQDKIEVDYTSHKNSKIKIKYNPKKGLCITMNPSKI